MACISSSEDNVSVTCGSKTHVLNLKSCKYESIDHLDSKLKPSEGNSVQCADGYDEQGLYLLSSEISQCGELLAFCTYLKTLIVVRIKESDMPVVAMYRIARGASKIKFTPITKNIVVADKSGDVYLFDTKHHQGSGTLILGHLSLLLDVLVTCDEQYIITCDRDEKIRVSSFPNGYNIFCYCLGHTEFVSSVMFLPSNNDYLISTSGDGTVRFWNFKIGKELMIYNAFNHLLTNNIENEKDENISAIVDATAIHIDQTTSLICACLDFFNTCLVFKCTLEENTLKCDLTQKIPFKEFSPWKVDISANTLWVILNSNDTVRVEAFSLNREELVFEETVSDSISKALNILNSVKISVDSKKNVTNLLFKRKFDNVQDYLEKKEARIVLKESTNKKLKSV